MKKSVLRRLSGLAVLTTLLPLTLHAAEPAATFNAAQQEQIGKIAEEYLAAHPEKLGEAISVYLADHPEFLVVASDNLRQRQQASQQQAMQQLAVEYKDRLLSKESPSVGPQDAKAAVVMFFDYQCSYCSKMAPVVEALMKANPDVRFVFKEFPIFAKRWPVSGLAARTGLKVWQQKGGEAYITYHNALYATGHMEGALTEQDVATAAAPYLDKATLDALKKDNPNGAEDKTLNEVENLASQMKFSGTPGFVILPQSADADPTQFTVVPGATTQDALQAAIAKVTGK